MRLGLPSIGPTARRFLAVLILAGSVTTVAAAPRGALAQYFYLDVDGDGVGSWFREWAPNTDTTTVDVYVVTDKNLDGSPVICGSGGGSLDLWTYSLHLLGTGDPFQVVSIESLVPGMVESFPPVTNSFGATVGYYTSNWLPPGTHRLLRLKIVFDRIGYCPSMEVASSSCYSPPGVGTMVGLDCVGHEEVPVEGMGFGYCTDPPNRRPSVSAPAEIVARAGDPISFPVAVADPECGGSYLFSFFAQNEPHGSAVSALGPFAYGKATATFSWTPTADQAGTYSVIFTAHDPDTWNWWVQADVSDTTHITVASTLSAEQGPVANAGGPYVGRANISIAFQGAASSDPEGGVLRYTWDFGDGGVGEGIAPEHTFSMGGVYDVALAVTNEAGLSGGDHTTATIVNSPSLITSVAPNPVTRESVLEFMTTRAGYAHMRIFDARGRVVARPLESSSLSAGRHRVPMLGWHTGLASGVYFVRLVTEYDGTETRRIATVR